MAQACVMVPPSQQMEAVRTPTKGPQGPQLDTSLITSAVRKRKADHPDALSEEKKSRSGGAVKGYGLTLALPAAAHVVPTAAGADEAQEQQQGMVLHPHNLHHQQEHEDEETEDAAVQLFSPSFHVLHGASCAAVSCTAAAAEPGCPDGGGPQAAKAAAGASAVVDNSSTDHSTSTGTSATLDTTDGSSCEERGGGGAGSASTSAPASPEPPQAGVHAAADANSGEAGDEDDYLDFDPFLFIKRLPPVNQCIPPRHHFLLPRQTRRSNRKTLVLDLDETLVHSTLDGYCRSDFVFPVEVGAVRHMVSVRQRPHLHTFLQRVAQLFEVVVFTASQRVYAEQLLNLVDPGRRLIRHRVFRESCVFWEGNYLKDLTVLGRDLAHTIIVDNSPQAFGFQLDNGIPIESWYDDDSDQELLKLLPFLEELSSSGDVRPHIQDRFRLRQLVDAAPEPKSPLLV